MFMGKTICGRQKQANCVIRCLFVFACAIFLNNSYAQSSGIAIQLPNTINGGARDRIVTPERFECENSLSGKAQLEYGVAASSGTTNNTFATSQTNGNAVTVYGKIVIPIGAPKSRIDCDRLFQLEMRRRELEIKLLEQQTLPGNFTASEAPRQAQPGR